MLHPGPDSRFLVDYYRAELLRQLTTDLWIAQNEAYKCADTRPWWKKRLSRMQVWIYWKTLGRFRAWLHRDCGDY